MEEVRYADIEQMIVKHFQSGAYMTYVFKCPESGREVQSDPIHMADFVNVAKIKAQEKKNGFLYKLKMNILGMVQQNVGRNEFSNSIAGSVKGKMDDFSGYSISESEKQKGAVVAFNKEVHRKNFTHQDGKWVHKDAVAT